MAGAGRKVWTTETLTSREVQDYFQDQAVMVFASASARANAIPAPSEGMVTYLRDTDLREFYTGSVWRPLHDFVTVADATARAALGAYQGLLVLQADVNVLYLYTGGRWRLVRNEWRQSGAGGASATAIGPVASTTYAYVAATGSKLTTPADGTLRGHLATGVIQCTGVGWIRLRLDRGDGTSTYHPNATGMKSQNTGGDTMTVLAGFTSDGTTAQQPTLYWEIRSDTSNSATFYVPQLMMIEV